MAKKSTSDGETPLMRQYNQFKAQHPNAILLFRIGDFYETFGEDARKTSAALGITLTKRNNGSSDSDLAGFPHHAMNIYLPKLIRQGYRVAVCDQLEDPKLAKTIVKRGITELITPGLAMGDNLLDSRENNFLASVHRVENKGGGIAFLDLSTGEFYVAEGSDEYLDKLIQNFNPHEILVQKNRLQSFTDHFGSKILCSTLEDWAFAIDFATNLLQKHFQVTSFKGFGIENMTNGIIAAGAALHYLSETQHDRIKHITKLTRIEEDQYVWLDRFTIRNLELVGTSNENADTLLGVIDHTISPMGSRLLRQWIMLPLKNKMQIERRLQAVRVLKEMPEHTQELQTLIKQIGDLERLIGRASTGRITPRELLQVYKALKGIKAIKKLCETIVAETQPQTATTIFSETYDQLNSCSTIASRIGRELAPEPPVAAGKGHIIADGVNAELDELRTISRSGKDYLVQLQQNEAIKTGITSLKVGYNNVFGYYLEVTNAHKHKVPGSWIRKQTLTGAERYITPELKEYEEKILGAEEKILALEQRLFADLVASLTEYIQPIQNNARLVAQLDVLQSFAKTAEENNYVQPEIDESMVLDIKNGRHPVIEKHLPMGEEYVANNVYLDTEQQQIIIITGPNMSGKSALLRQTGLIVLMAQMGSYVPADHARIGIVDKIFTRVGASDNISSGESTFMVEMNESANILNNISARSLVLLDEIGRGTSTYDGISIAWSIAEYLHENGRFRPKVLFATHYHELNEMAETLPRIKNYHVTVREMDNRVIFLRKLAEGGSEHSFGLHVARMAGMPKAVLSRAEQILKALEQRQSENAVTDPSPSMKAAVETATKKPEAGMQLSFITLDDPLLEQIRDEILNTDIDSLTPMNALLKLDEIKRLLNK